MRDSGYARMRNRLSNRNTTVLAAALLSSVLMAGAPHAAWAQSAPVAQAWQLAAGPLDVALRRLAEQAQLTITFTPALVAGKTTRGLQGHYTPVEALERLLAGSGITWDVIDEATFSLRQAGGSGSRTATPQASPSARSEATPALPQIVDMHEVAVTGTRIRGAAPTAPVITITLEEMRQSGYSDLGQAMRALPQNFAGGQNPGVVLGAAAGGGANQNVTGASGANFRGLGPDATITLLNGSRLPYDGFSQATDIAIIPAAAIERIEILLDGASAIYGSDAVGGVANVVLRRDFQGAELSGRYGISTEGGYAQKQFTAVAGHDWGTGGFLIAGDISRNSSVRASQRDFLSGMTYRRTDIYPESDQKGLLISGHQKAGRVVDLSLDAFYTERKTESVMAASLTVGNFYPSYSRIWGVSPAADFALPGEWNLRVHGSAGRNDASIAGRTSFDLETGETTARSGDRYFNEAVAAGMEAEGPVFSLPGGDARLSVGGGWRRTSIDATRIITGAVLFQGDSTNRYGYGEISLPFVGREQGVAFVDRLMVNVAARYESYDSFGETTTPKIGLLWGITPDFDIRASWGRSFKAPALRTLYQAQSIYLYPAALLGGPGDGHALMLSGGNPNLSPETAKTLSAGFVARPGFLPGLSLELNWFQIDYRDRVSTPVTAFAHALSDPAYVDFVSIDPSLQQINATFAWAGLPEGTLSGNYTNAPYDPSNVVAILENFITNASADFMQGVDLASSYRMDAWGGWLALNASGSWITEARRRLTPTSPVVPTAGVAFFPAEFKARLGATWSRNGVTLSSILNHVGGVTDIYATPNRGRGSMTTLDLVVDYEMDVPVVGDIGFNLAIANAFNREPPFMQPGLPIHVNYDSTNYSALGRVVNMSLRKRF